MLAGTSILANDFRADICAGIVSDMDGGVDYFLMAAPDRDTQKF
jgi:hypothetical protein